MLSAAARALRARPAPRAARALHSAMRSGGGEGEFFAAAATSSMDWGLALQLESELAAAGGASASGASVRSATAAVAHRLAARPVAYASTSCAAEPLAAAGLELGAAAPAPRWLGRAGGAPRGLATALALESEDAVGPHSRAAVQVGCTGWEGGGRGARALDQAPAGLRGRGAARRGFAGACVGAEHPGGRAKQQPCLRCLQGPRAGERLRLRHDMEAGEEEAAGAN